MTPPTILHCLAQLPTRTGSGIYYHNLLAEFKKALPGRQLALYGIVGDEEGKSLSTGLASELATDRTSELATRPTTGLDTGLAADRHFSVRFSNPGVVAFSSSASSSGTVSSSSVSSISSSASSPDLPFSICGMSDEMPYPSTVFSQMTAKQLDLYQEVFRQKLEEIRSQEKPDLIICHHLWILTHLVLEVFPDLPVLAICHGTDLRQARQNPALKAKYVGNLQGLAGVAALSSLQVPEIAESYKIDPRQIRVTGGAYDPQIFYPADRVQPPRSGAINYLYAGKISHAKGVYELAEAFNRLSQDLPQAHLDIVGGAGPEVRQKIADRSKHNPRISFWDVEDQEVLAQHMRHSDIFVLPSYYEGLGLIALEALASGLRLVVTDLPALREQMGPDLASHPSISWVPMPPLQNLDEPLPAAIPDHINNLKAALLDQAVRLQASGRPIGVEKLVSQHSWSGLARKICRFITNQTGLDLGL